MLLICKLNNLKIIVVVIKIIRFLLWNYLLRLEKKFGLLKKI